MPEKADANVCNERGIRLAEEGQNSLAAREFRRAIELDPHSAPARDNLATLLADQGDLLSAIELYVAAIRAEPDNAPAYNYLGAFLGQYGPELMLGSYRRCLELDPRCVDALFNLGLALIELGRTTEALTPLERALELDPDNLEIMLEIGIASCTIGRHAEAIKMLRAVLKRDPQQVEAWTHLGRAFAGKGLYMEAERFLLHARENHSDDIPLLFELARVYYQWQGRQAKVRSCLKRAAALDTEALLDLIRRDPHGTVMMHAAGLGHMIDDSDLSQSDVRPIT